MVVPLIVVLIPGLRLVPSLYGWRVRSRIYRWYGALIALERRALGEHTAEERVQLLDELDDIEEAVNRMKMPLAYAGQFYVLREHIGFVRERLTAHDHDTPAGPPGAGGAPQARADAAPPAGAPPRATPGSA
ncbi:hypothetical protein CSX04_01718 [Burkholderia cepacia]|nr:hypothetical protein CSX04_01718 [Burkholderia cepacia]